MAGQTSNKTQINPLSNVTQINTSVNAMDMGQRSQLIQRLMIIIHQFAQRKLTYDIASATVINTSLRSDTRNATSINQALFHYGADIPLGTVLLDKYKVEQILSTGTGEAILYLCSYQGRKYVAKVYQRASAIKPGVMDALKKLDSPYVAKLYDSGTWLGMPFEIIPYYQNGSLQGRTYSFDELCNSLIPNLNEALHVLHQAGIIHKDLKPSNIMLCDDQKSVAIIDFGISSIRSDGRTVVQTKTGMTPDYSAPETFRNLFLSESDYYSLGITIYELFCGHTPYQGLDANTLAQYVAIQRIPFDDDFPKQLKELILGLTYVDITNRKDPANPNRRWTYEEVARWCRGENVPVPGMAASSPSEANKASAETRIDSLEPFMQIPPITFMYHKYRDLKSLVEALANDWQNGRKRLYRSTLSEYFRKFNGDLANICIDAEETVRLHPEREDEEYFRTLYRLYPSLKGFYWLNQSYADMQAFGKALLKSLQDDDKNLLDVFGNITSRQLLSSRESVVNRKNLQRVRQINAIETRYIDAKKRHDARIAKAQLYIIGYYYSKTHDLITPYGRFADIASLTDFLQEKLNSDGDIDSCAAALMEHVGNADEDSYENEQPTAQFYAWLTVQGKGAAIAGNAH